MSYCVEAWNPSWPTLKENRPQSLKRSRSSQGLERQTCIQIVCHERHLILIWQGMTVQSPRRASRGMRLLNGWNGEELPSPPRLRQLAFPQVCILFISKHCLAKWSVVRRSKGRMALELWPRSLLGVAAPNSDQLGICAPVLRNRQSAMCYPCNWQTFLAPFLE